MTNRLTISDDIQLFFRREGNAWYSSRSGKLPEQIEEIVYEWQNTNSGHPEFDFSEKWLQAFEPRDQRQQELLIELRGAYDKFCEHIRRKLMDMGVPKHGADEHVRKIVEATLRNDDSELLTDPDREGMK